VPIVSGRSADVWHGGPLFRQVGIYSRVGQLYEPVGREPRCSITRKRRTDRFWKKESRKRDRCRRFIAAGNGPTRIMEIKHDSIFYLLFDVRIPAHRGFDLGRRRTCVCRGFLIGGNFRAPPLLGRRGTFSIRTGKQPCAGAAGAEFAGVTIRRLLTKSP